MIEGMRLQRVLADAGLGSRRACESLIAQGRVQVDGQTVAEMGRRVDPASAVIHVDGLRLSLSKDLVHLALNKPRGMHSTMADDQGRPCVGDLLADRRERLFHVGRLDADTEGLLLLMNDGELAHRLMHPSFEVAKTYVAEVIGPVPRSVGKQLRAGVDLDDGPARASEFRLLSAVGNRVMIEIVVHEGRKHIVRRMLDAVDLPVQRLVRTRVGTVDLGDTRPGRMRKLTQQEVGKLYQLVGL